LPRLVGRHEANPPVALHIRESTAYTGSRSKSDRRWTRRRRIFWQHAWPRKGMAGAGTRAWFRFQPCGRCTSGHGLGSQQRKILEDMTNQSSVLRLHKKVKFESTIERVLRPSQRANGKWTAF
jgi:hypothetical protein